MTKKAFFLGIVFFYWIWPWVSSASLVPASILRWPDRGPEHAVLVDKSQQKVYLYQRDVTKKPLRVFPCSTGENQGAKTRKNDRKTPEGIYFFLKAYVERDLAPIYGSKAFPLDYPSPLDRRMGRGGYGIWFHGTNEPLKPRDSNGCIVLENGHIDELGRYIRLRDTPVIISENIRLTPFEKVKEEARLLEGIVMGWKRAWEEKDISNYMDFYSRRFTSRGMDWRKWKAYKTRIARKYKRIHITIENLGLFKSNGVVLALFDQTYRTESYESRGRKRLYFIKNSENWRIFSEYFERYKDGQRPPRKSPDPWRDIPGFVTAWKKAWEKKDLKTYMSCYDRDFHARGMNRNAWKQHRGRLNRKYRSLAIAISELKITGMSATKAEVRFKQHYKADTYEDLGIKKLLLVKRGRHWKIKRETWDLITAGSAL